MDDNLIRFLQAVSYIYSKWEEVPQKDSQISLSDFKASISPSVKHIWGLGDNLIEEAIEDAVNSYKAKNTITPSNLNKVSSKVLFLASRIANG